LSNATRIGVPGVFEALRKVDNAILKLDGATDEQVALVNRPVGKYRVADIVRQLKRFDGDFVLQTLFLRGPGWATEDWISAWMDRVRELKPREVMVYTIDRETPMSGLGKYTEGEMRALVQPLLDEGYVIQIKG
jgi:wyosine [tRNA(Phe)-imidazoG37] synthetase (radical SAM superfamily)